MCRVELRDPRALDPEVWAKRPGWGEVGADGWGLKERAKQQFSYSRNWPRSPLIGWIMLDS